MLVLSFGLFFFSDFDYLLDGYFPSVVECHHYWVSFQYVPLSHCPFCLIYEFPVEMDLMVV